MKAKWYVHGLLLDAMFTAVVVLVLELLFELPPQAARSSAAAATAIGTAKLRRRRLIEWIPPTGEPNWRNRCSGSSRAPRACTARLLRGVGPIPSERRIAPGRIEDVRHGRERRGHRFPGTNPPGYRREEQRRDRSGQRDARRDRSGQRDARTGGQRDASRTSALHAGQCRPCPTAERVDSPLLVLSPHAQSN